jgi:Protein O-mannosyl-transferase TMEM260-like
MIAVFVFCATFAVYLITLAPTISFFDSGELISGAYTLGVAHPPGYPVYMTIGKLFTLIPLGNVAYRMNILSAFFASMTSIMVYYITRAMLDDEAGKRALPGFSSERFGVPEAAGLFAALAFGFSYTLWAWAIVSKFYTLNAFVVSCIVMLLIRWRRARRDDTAHAGHSLRYLYIIAFICGIAGAVHISQFVLIPIYVMYVLLVDWRTFFDVPAAAAKGKGKPKKPSFISYLAGFQFKTVIIMGFFFLLGHSVYLHLPLRALQEPLINWGGAVNWEQFRWTYNREGYQVVGGERSLPLFWAQLQSFSMPREFGWAGIPLILGGIYAHIRKDWKGAALLLAGSLLMTFAVVYGGNPPKENIFLLEQFYIPVYIFLAVLMGGAVAMMLRAGTAGAVLAGLALPFIFIGAVPRGASTHAARSGIEAMVGTSLPVYLAVYAVLALVVAGGTWALARGAFAGRPRAYLGVILILFMLYPAYQLKDHYWKNDRSKNFLAFDMGTAELNFAPQFALLFTWGDSGAFPMWYLQDVERKRPDVLLVHTPHLPLDWFLYSIKREPAQLGDPSQIAKDYSLLRNYNGVRGVENILKMPEAYREPSYVIRQLMDMNPDRVFTFDYSTRYSIRMPFVAEPYGILYMKQKKEYAEKNNEIWNFMVTRGLPNPTISMDLDDAKASRIYGFVLADLGKRYLEMGLDPLAEQQFILAVRYTPELWDSLSQYAR